MRSDRKQKGEIGHDGRWRGVMEDEEKWWEAKRSDGRRRGVMGDERRWRGVMGDEKEWWEMKRQKEMMGSKQKRKRDNGKWNNGRRKGWNNEK